MPRKILTLKENIELLEYSKHQKSSVRKLVEHFKIGKTQAADIIKNREKLMKLWCENGNKNQIRISSENGPGFKIDRCVFDWFSEVRSKKYPVSGPMLQEKAREAAEKLGIKDFKASNGWLEKFRKRHISFKSISGESASVDTDMVKEWLEKLPSLLKDYALDDVLNTDKTGLFFGHYRKKLRV
ncbi:tigger transposable element-derived protein 4-like [Parasteatoda tepidariorum]|uniref:tigger transposable element-derived protein 4-like n=1 Tax=Parasteatoda tepidariorum TaxID=114398 RepID=UPI001C725F12|nr:tigger transposable element-derived protein 4-like [Parasteatoda tepidariorum]